MPRMIRLPLNTKRNGISDFSKEAASSATPMKINCQFFVDLYSEYCISLLKKEFCYSFSQICLFFKIVKKNRKLLSMKIVFLPKRSKACKAVMNTQKRKAAIQRIKNTSIVEFTIDINRPMKTGVQVSLMYLIISCLNFETASPPTIS